MIEIITEPVVIPSNPRYQKDKINNRWVVIDTLDNSVRYKGAWENVCIACHNLNKKWYRE